MSTKSARSPKALHIEGIGIFDPLVVLAAGLHVVYQGTAREQAATLTLFR